MKSETSKELEPFLITKPEFYKPTCIANLLLEEHNEVDIYLAAKEVTYRGKKTPLPVLLTGPTGSAKTTLIRYCSYKRGIALLTVPGHEGLAGDDLIGGHISKRGESLWIPGMAYLATKYSPGGTLYLDEVVEARPDVITVVNPLTDWRRTLEVLATNEHIEAQSEFSLDLSFNPGYQSVRKDLKMSLRQRCVAIPIHYPGKEDDEVEILDSLINEQNINHNEDITSEIKKTKITRTMISSVAKAARDIRGMAEGKMGTLKEGPSPRLELYALLLMREGINPRDACFATLCYPLTENAENLDKMRAHVKKYF